MDSLRKSGSLAWEFQLVILLPSVSATFEPAVPGFGTSYTRAPWGTKSLPSRESFMARKEVGRAAMNLIVPELTAGPAMKIVAIFAITFVISRRLTRVR